MDGPEPRGFWSVEKRPDQCADTGLPLRGQTVVPRHRRERCGDGSSAVPSPGRRRTGHCLCQQVTGGERTEVLHGPQGAAGRSPGPKTL